MTIIATPSAANPPRSFPSGIALVAAAELVLIALLLLLSNSPGFYAAAIACSLCSIQLGMLLIARFRVNTLNVRKLAKQAEFSTSMVLITDAQGRIKWTNPSFNRTTRFDLSAIAGQTFSMVLHGQDTDTREVEKSVKRYEPLNRSNATSCNTTAVARHIGYRATVSRSATRAGR